MLDARRKFGRRGAKIDPESDENNNNEIPKDDTNKNEIQKDDDIDIANEFEQFDFGHKEQEPFDGCPDFDDYCDDDPFDPM